MIEERVELVDILKRASDRSSLSNIILPFCSNISGERPPIALLSGNLDMKSTLKFNGESISLHDALGKLEGGNSATRKGKVIHLTEEIKRLQIDTDDSSEKEVEIKEEWTREDEMLLLSKKNRNSLLQPMNVEPPSFENGPSKLSNDIELLLQLAEEEEDLELSHQSPPPSKLTTIKTELLRADAKTSKVAFIPKLKLPKSIPTNSLVGDIIEHCSESNEPVKEPPGIEQDASQSLVSAMENFDLKTESLPLKKSSRFVQSRHINE